MTPRPTDAGNFAEAVYAEMVPVALDDEQNAWALLIFLGANGQMVEDLDLLAHSNEGHDPWTILLDVNRVPDAWLAWLAQFVGVTLDTTQAVDRQRQQIREHEQWGRGRPQSIRNAAYPYLIGTKTVVLVERDTSPYHYGVYVYGDEAPPEPTYQSLYDNYLTYQAFLDAWPTYRSYWLSFPFNQMYEALLKAKPAGLQFVLTVTPGSPGAGNDYQEVYLKYNTYQELWNARETYEDVYVEG